MYVVPEIEIILVLRKRNIMFEKVIEKYTMYMEIEFLFFKTSIPISGM